MNRFVQIGQGERRRRSVAKLQERNQRLQEEITFNEQIIEELIEDPEPSPGKKKNDTPTPKKKTRKEEREESLEKARACALDRKNYRDSRKDG